MSLRVRQAGGAALAALRAGPANVFASFEHSCYVETPAGIACLGAGIGLGPLNAIVEDFEVFPVGASVFIESKEARLWTPAAPSRMKKIPAIDVPQSIREPALVFLDWLSGGGHSADELIGLGPGLTPAGDDFVGGAMIALRAFGHAADADRIAAWALPLAAANTSRISRAHLACAAAGEGHEALHAYLHSFEKKHLQALGRIGHTSGLDAAAGALRALSAVNIHGQRPASPDVLPGIWHT
jgi:hypothetical protein